VVTPPTLGVITVPEVSQVIQYPVPQLDFDNGTGENLWYTDVANSDPLYNGPYIDLHRLALITASSGFIQPVAPIWSNATYNLTFFGPSIKCQPYPVQGVSSVSRQSPGGDYAYYVSAPIGGSLADQLESLSNMSDPFNSGAEQQIVTCAVDSNFYTSLNQTGGQSIKFYVYFDEFTTASQSDLLANGTDVQECILYNSSYNLQFRYTNGQQTVEFKNVVEMNQLNSIVNASNDCVNGISHDADCIHYNRVTKYTTVFQSLTQLLIGFIVGPLAGGEGVDGFTRLFETGLIYTTEFAGWRTDSGIKTPPDALHINNMTLIEGIEQLMQNITLSLFSKSQFLQSSPANIPVEILAPTLVYNYQWQNLVIGYSAAAAFTLLTIGFGIWSIIQNKAVHSNSISAVIRTSRNPELDDLIKAEDTDGSNPSPGYLKKTKIRLQPFTSGGIAGRSSAFVVVSEKEAKHGHKN
jgi:hypothetical protein